MFLTDNGSLHKLSFITFLSQWCLILLYRLSVDAICFSFFTAKQRARAAPPTTDSVLFEDTSSAPPAMNSQGYYTPGYNMGAPSNDMQGGPGMNNLFTDPMANAAMMYGSSLANQGKDMVNKEVRKCRIFIWFIRVPPNSMCR